MRTITDSMLHRLEAQAQEAKVLGLTKIASNLEHEVGQYSDRVRSHDSVYSYARNEMNDDVQKHIWDAVIRVADFYGTTFDASNMQTTIEKIAEELVHDVGVSSGVKDGVGAYEPFTPGEHREYISIDLNDDV